MKNFDLNLYLNPETNGDHSAWLAMCEKCFQEYLRCKDRLSSVFTDWYENGGFHDAYLRDVRVTPSEKGTRNVMITLEAYDGSGIYSLCYHGVSRFSVEQREDLPVFSCEEQCLYEDFYRREDERITHEFFTTAGTLFCIDFSNMTCTKRKIR